MSEATAKKRAGNMASLIYDQLRAGILNGELKSGAPLSQLKIAKASGTSRGPVREALRRLQQDQLVIARANRRFNVAPFDIGDLEAVLSLHLANVTLAIRVGVPFITPQELEQLEHCVTVMEKSMAAGDALKWEAAYRDFTLTIVKHTGPRTESLIDHLIDNIQRYRANKLKHLPIAYSGGPEFREILGAVAAGDGKLASSRYASLASRVSTLILADIAPHHDGARLRAYVQMLAPGDGR